MAKFVEVDNGKFVNLEKISGIELKLFAGNDNTRTCVCKFYTEYSSEKKYALHSRNFDTEEKAKEWLENLLKDAGCWQ